MSEINIAGLTVASLSEEQLATLNSTQAQLNQMATTDKEIYLLAVTQDKV
ncbi:hypothetical protein [Desulforamulus aeronauticus]|uniref:Uncharacterized protein n=1 Tax=Desulforamulus aeronauticus DSM 10349 TaxID=1121421 RepID=A0A1M6QUW2_9FIRM|nr:hypothetical protein [Desulforamulus aeronauticus]SHK23986.1 hypothetical protein SAMN02745123_01218 [Desulforamulus aeronauticus DSM 10349]